MKFHLTFTFINGVSATAHITRNSFSDIDLKFELNRVEEDKPEGFDRKIASITIEVCPDSFEEYYGDQLPEFLTNLLENEESIIFHEN